MRRATPDLRRRLAARSLPLAVTLVAVTTLSTPVAFYVVRVGELRTQGRAVAERIARQLHHEATRRPVLWRYDSIKILEHLRAYADQPDVARIEVVDREGRPVGNDRPGGVEGAVLWVTMPIGTGEPPAGEVWVGMSLASAREAALLLAAPFLLLGLILAALAFGGQVAIRVAELEEAYRELQEKDARLRALSARAVALQESERRAIARELHDAVGQVLTAVRINLQLLEQTGGTSEVVARTRELTDTAIEEVRRAVDLLGPAILADVGLASAVERHCADVAERTGLRIECRTELDGAPPSPAAEATAYRLVQEALHNAVRHAEATTVSVELRANGDGLECRVEDDGRGFEPPAGGAGHGLASMRERTELLGGTFRIRSAPGAGTTVDASLPFTRAESREPIPETRADGSRAIRAGFRDRFGMG